MDEAKWEKNGGIENIDNDNDDNTAKYEFTRYCPRKRARTHTCDLTQGVHTELCRCL